MAKQEWLELIETSMNHSDWVGPNGLHFKQLIQHIGNFFDGTQIEEFAKFVADEETETEEE